MPFGFTDELKIDCVVIFLYSLWHGIRPSYKHIKKWGVRVYIINGRATRKKLDYRSHRGYFMRYKATTGFILYSKPDQPFIIHGAHDVWFDEYNSASQ